MRVKCRLLHALALLVLAADHPVYPQVPPWAVSRSDANHPSGEYILGVGQGTGENADETAKRLAQSDIAAQVRVKVQAEIKNIQRVYGLNPNQESYADFKIQSTSVVDEELPDAAIVETAVDASTKTTYALAALDREKISSALAVKLTSGWDRANELQHTAEDFLHRGRLAEAIQDLFEAWADVMELLPKLALHDALAHEPFLSERSLSPSAVTSGIREALSGVRIEKISGDKQKGKIGENFPEPFVVHVTVNEGGNAVPVAGAAIVFLNLAGEQFGEALTDVNGTASCLLRARRSIGRQLRARLSLPSLGKEFFSDLNFSSRVFDCVLLEADVAFSLKIDVRSSKVNDALRSIVVDAVTHAGYQIVDMSRFMLRVGFQSTPAAAVDSADGPLYSVSSGVTLMLIDKDSNRTLGSINGTSQGIAKTQDGALEQSVRGMKLQHTELVLLLEKAKN